jgi:dolichyl-phosphate beta-glucosyltransferase
MPQIAEIGSKPGTHLEKVSIKVDGGQIPTNRRSVSIVVPAFNEAGRLPDGLVRLKVALATLHLAAQVIVVDDGSSDGTADVARAGLAAFPGAVVLRLPDNCGKGAAVRAGVAVARHDTVVFMDADMSSDPADLGRLLAELEWADIAIGSRSAAGAVVEGVSGRRQIMGVAFNWLARRAAGIDLRDTQCGFKAFRQPAASHLFGRSSVDGFAFDVEVLALAAELGYRVAEVPIHWQASKGSRVRAVRDSVVMTLEMLRLARRRPAVPAGEPVAVVLPALAGPVRADIDPLTIASVIPATAVREAGAA